MSDLHNPDGSLEAALVRSIDSSALRDLSADLGEVALDRFLEDGPAKDIPILGSLLKIKSSVGLVRDYIFAKKVTRFLIELARIPESKRADFHAKLQERGEARRVGEILLVLLDRLDDYERAELLAKMFRAHIEKDFPLDTFRRLATAAEQLPPGSVTALRAIYTSEAGAMHTGGEFLSQFAGLGLVSIEFFPSTMGDIGGCYDRTDLGKLFLSILDDQS